MLKKILPIYKECFIKTNQQLVKGWRIFPGVFLIYLSYLLVAAPLLGSLPQPFGSILISIFYAICVSLFLSWIARVVNKQSLGWENLIEFNQEMFIKIINTGFIFFLFDLVLRSFGSNSFLPLAVNFVFAFIFNCVPEVLNRLDDYGIAALKTAYDFSCKYFVFWFFPYLVLLIPNFLTLDFKLAFHLFAFTDHTLPVNFYFVQVMNIMHLIIPQKFVWGFYLIFLSSLLSVPWIFCFRANLFEKIYRLR